MDAEDGGHHQPQQEQPERTGELVGRRGRLRRSSGARVSGAEAVSAASAATGATGAAVVKAAVLASRRAARSGPTDALPHSPRRQPQHRQPADGRSRHCRPGSARSAAGCPRSGPPAWAPRRPAARAQQPSARAPAGRCWLAAGSGRPPGVTGMVGLHRGLSDRLRLAHGHGLRLRLCDGALRLVPARRRAAERPTPAPTAAPVPPGRPLRAGCDSTSSSGPASDSGGFGCGTHPRPLACFFHRRGLGQRSSLNGFFDRSSFFGGRAGVLDRGRSLHRLTPTWAQAQHPPPQRARQQPLRVFRRGSVLHRRDLPDGGRSIHLSPHVGAGAASSHRQNIFGRGSVLRRRNILNRGNVHDRGRSLHRLTPRGRRCSSSTEAASSTGATSSAGAGASSGSPQVGAGASMIGTASATGSGASSTGAGNESRAAGVAAGSVTGRAGGIGMAGAGAPEASAARRQPERAGAGKRSRQSAAAAGSRRWCRNRRNTLRLRELRLARFGHRGSPFLQSSSANAVTDVRGRRSATRYRGLPHRPPPEAKIACTTAQPSIRT